LDLSAKIYINLQTTKNYIVFISNNASKDLFIMPFTPYLSKNTMFVVESKSVV